MLLAALSSLSVAAHAADESPLKDLLISGFFDVYYQHSFNNPSAGSPLSFRQLDVKHASFGLSSFQLNVVKPTSAESPFGFTIQAVSGKATDILHAAEPGGAETYKWLQQAYLTYASPDGTTVDLGKFTSWIGYEGVMPVNNDLYSISFLFYFAQPSYHMGLRATKPLGPVTTSLYLVNGWNEAEDSNANKSYGATLSSSVLGTNVTVNYYGGVEGSNSTNGFYGVAGGGESAVNLVDFIATKQIDKLKLAVNADYGDLKGSSGPSGHFSGIEGIAKYQFTDKFSAAVRYETVSDPNGTRSGLDARFNSFTGGVEYSVNPASVLRLELRSDTSNRNVFEGDGGPKKSRSTLTLAHIFKF